MFPADQLENDLERVRGVGLKAHGLSVVELVRDDETAPWTPVVGAPLNRRFLDDTAYAFTGPAAGSELLRTSVSSDGTTALGTFGDCAGGTTVGHDPLRRRELQRLLPLSGTSEQDARYGLTDEPTVRGWESSIRASMRETRASRTR